LLKNQRERLDRIGNERAQMIKWSGRLIVRRRDRTTKAAILAKGHRIVTRETTTHEYATIATWTGAD
jgi:hypothetical protein